MSTRIDFGVCGVLLLAIALVAAWVSWEETIPHGAWVLDDPERIITDFTPREELEASFRLRNTARAPLRILGDSAC